MMTQTIAQPKPRKERKVYLDVLRVCSMIVVVAVHLIASGWYELSPRTAGWQILNFYESGLRWALPVIVMLSGTLFLEPKRNVSVKKLYTVNILRMVTAYLFWSAAYLLLYPESGFSLALVIEGGCFHLWYQFMIIGLYMMVPLYRQLVQNRKAMENFLMVGIGLSFIVPTLMYIPGLNVLQPAFDSITVRLGLGYSVYFVLGYYVNSTEWTMKQRRIIYLLGVLGFVYTLAGTSILSVINNAPVEKPFLDDFSPAVLMETVAVFVLAKYGLANVKADSRFARWTFKLAECTFGVYLVHVWAITLICDWTGLEVVSFTALLSVPLLTVLVFGLSVLITAVLRLIPGVRKYIV